MAETIVGISPGTRSLGIAVFREKQLIDWTVKSFKGKWNQEKLKHMMTTIERLIEYYAVTAVILKQPDPLRGSKQLDNLVEQLRYLIKKKRLKLKQYSLQDLWFYCGGRGRNIKALIAEKVIEQYVHLKDEYYKERNSDRPYYSKMFEAIVACLVYLDER